jgi:hypothetical protein
VGWNQWKKEKPHQGMLKVVGGAFAPRGRHWAPSLNCPLRPAVMLAGWGWLECPSLAAKCEQDELGRGWVSGLRPK